MFKFFHKISALQILTISFKSIESANMPEASCYVLAKMCENVYDLENGVNLSKLNKGVDSEGYRVVEDSIEREGRLVCCMAVYKHSSNGNTVLAIKGTDTGNGSDLVNDLSMVIGGTGSAVMVQPTLYRARQLISQYNVNLITGHSLGGYMTEILATNDGIMGIAFCAPGTNGPKVSLGGREVTGFHNVNFEYDLAGNVMSGVYTHVQWSIFVKCVGNQYTHGIQYMVEYFSGRKSITNKNVQSRSSSYPTGYYYPN